jgi:hypothetical protein
MPRIQKRLEPPRARHPAVVGELAEELRHSHESGQPRIEELTFPKTGTIHVTVLWDRWDPLADEERAVCILQAYEQVEGAAFRDRIGLAVGLTFPEARASGLLPFRVIPAVRPDDRVTLEQCVAAMKQLGASTLEQPDWPLLGFATFDEAEACVRRLRQELPGSDSVWLVEQEVGRTGG